MTLEDLNGQVVKFGGMYKIYSGVSAAYVLINDKIYKFTEDESDGYRSYCEEHGEVPRPENAIFSLEHAPIKLRAEYSDNSFRGLKLFYKEVEVAELGTEAMDDYYPCCRMFFDAEALTRAITETGK